MRLPRVPNPLPRLLRLPSGKLIIAAIAGVIVVTIGLAGWKLLRPSSHPRVDLSAKVPTGPVTPAPRPTTLVTFAQGCSTSECHASMLGAPLVKSPAAHATCEQCHAPDTTGKHLYPVLHASLSGCTTCHTDLSGVSHATGTAGTGGGGHRNDCLNCHSPHVTTDRFKLLGSAGTNGCTACHPAAEGRYRHESYAEGACSACHHVHSSLAFRGATEDSASSCGACHPFAAAAVKEGPGAHGKLQAACLACHVPHASDNKGLLLDKATRLCTSCHENVKLAAASSLVPHGGAQTTEQCLACHDPHSGRNAGMLVSEETTLCLGCHANPLKAPGDRIVPEMATVIAKSSVKHGPMGSGNCGACHNVHGTPHASLLRRNFARIPAGKFDIHNYDFCFACHDSELVSGNGVGATAFRAGTTNLHRIHLQKGERSTGCLACHEAHGGNHKRLIVESSSYEGSDWKTPMNFTLTPDGGSCSPGCHAPATYSRNRPSPSPSPSPAPKPQPERGVP